MYPRNDFAPYFGENRKYKPEENPDDQLSHETYNLPDAYKGSNKHLVNVLDFMIRKEDEFYTSKLLPWAYTDELHVQWEIFRFNRTLMDVEPEQGIPRLVTAETEARSDSLLRRGLAFIIEHGFMTTERGRRHFMLNLQQITDAVHTTAYYGVMFALLTSRRHYKEWNRTNSRIAKRPRNLRKGERSRWAIVQKSHKGLYILDAEIKHQMQQNGITPNVWVFPSKMSIYLDMVPIEQTQYQLKGPKAAGNLEEDRSQSGIRWRGTEVFEAESFDIDFVNESQNLLQRQRQIGEFFVIKHNDHAIKIFSADHDDFKQITYSDAKTHCLNSPELLEMLPSSIAKLYDVFSGARNVNVGEEEETEETTATETKLNDDVVKEALESFKTALRVSLDKVTSPQDSFEENLPFVLDSNNDMVMEKTWKDLFKVVRKKIAAATKKEPALKPTEKKLVALIDSSGSFNHYIKHWEFNSMMEKVENPEMLVDEVVKFLSGTLAELKVLSADTRVNEAYITSAQNILASMYSSIPYLYWHIRHAEQQRDILIFRPYQTYRMSSAILAAGGAELGETFHGHHDFQLSDDIIRKVHVGHYTHYSKSVVKNPKRFSIAEDIFAQGYVSGEGIEFFDKVSVRNAVDYATVGDSDLENSLIAWSIPIGSADHLVACDITGRFEGDDLDFNEPGEDTHFNNSAELKDIIYDTNRTEGGSVDDRFLEYGTNPNTVCFRGMQYSQKRQPKPRSTITTNYQERPFKLTNLGNGHWKNLTYGGCMDVREGLMMNSQSKNFKLGEVL